MLFSSGKKDAGSDEADNGDDDGAEDTLAVRAASAKKVKKSQEEYESDVSVVKRSMYNVDDVGRRPFQISAAVSRGMLDVAVSPRILRF